jgi:hypothetical protein
MRCILVTTDNNIIDKYMSGSLDAMVQAIGGCWAVPVETKYCTIIADQWIDLIDDEEHFLVNKVATEYYNTHLTAYSIGATIVGDALFVGKADENGEYTDCPEDVWQALAANQPVRCPLHPATAEQQQGRR